MLTVSDKVGELRVVVNASLMSDEEKRAVEYFLETIMRMNSDAMARRRTEADGIKDRLQLAFPGILAAAGVLWNAVIALSHVGLGVAADSLLMGYWIVDGAYGTNVQHFVVWLFNHRVEDWYYIVLVVCFGGCIPFLIVLFLARSVRVSGALVGFVRRLVLRGRELGTEE